jgi:hypothetical protein
MSYYTVDFLSLKGHDKRAIILYKYFFWHYTYVYFILSMYVYKNSHGQNKFILLIFFFIFFKADTGPGVEIKSDNFIQLIYLPPS